MPRKRSNTNDNWLPSRVYRGKYSYEFRPKSGGCVTLLKIKRDTDGKPVETDSLKHDVFVAHAKANSATTQREDFDWLIRIHMASLQWKELSNSQQQSDILRLKRISPAFGKMLPSSIGSGHIRQYMDKLGETKKPSANRDHGFLSRLFNWGIERNYIRVNPCEKVKKFPEQARSRYIEDWEYDLVYKIAIKSSYPWIAPLMEIAYICRMRDSEVRGILEDVHIRDKGIFVERSKHSKNEITAWSPRLRKAVEDARNLCDTKGPTREINRPLFKGRSGGPITATNRKSGWRRIRELAMEEGLEINGEIITLKESFTFHDIKAKGITDHESKAGGHRSKKMEAVYDRKPEIVKATR